MIAAHRWTPARLVGVIGYAVIGVCLVVLFVSDFRQDQFDAKRATDIAAARAETVHCIQKVLDTQLQDTGTLREAAKVRNDADYEVKRLAIDEQRPLSDPAVIGAWRTYRDAHRAYNKALQANPVPDVEKECGS